MFTSYDFNMKQRIVNKIISFLVNNIFALIYFLTALTKEVNEDNGITTFSSYFKKPEIKPQVIIYRITWVMETKSGKVLGINFSVTRYDYLLYDLLPLNHSNKSHILHLDEKDITVEIRDFCHHVSNHEIINIKDKREYENIIKIAHNLL